MRLWGKYCSTRRELDGALPHVKNDSSFYESTQLGAIHSGGIVHPSGEMTPDEATFVAKFNR